MPLMRPFISSHGGMGSNGAYNTTKLRIYPFDGCSLAVFIIPVEVVVETAQVSD